ncbi:hypothetical protein FYJ38_00365 [Clostridium sp. WB02_MRS01]|uniref:hypothetical protein n=1 Tax=Clostridium sp. WB02_MRS01 TaxID=2605777 RepID=UPI0012B39376|nr:hypothetical protein [Clostridium sp. WB02_MRS01]MSS07092.1 hypothetical protein [Clostridium sp. WB02_MRS01]
MEEVIRYKCKYCGELLDTKVKCLAEEDKHERVVKANELLEEGYTLGEINTATNIWYEGEVPEYLLNVTYDSCFVVEYWQCCNKPAYQIIRINIDGSVRLSGCGSWSGYYGGDVNLRFRYLKNPRPKDELFIDKRFRSMC